HARRWSRLASWRCSTIIATILWTGFWRLGEKLSEITVPADAKALAYMVLSGWFPNANVSGLFPGDDDKSMVLPHLGFEIAGGRRLNRITDIAHITIRAWAESEEDASTLCRRAYAVLMA